jgi:hypothetical protein
MTPNPLRGGFPSSETEDPLLVGDADDGGELGDVLNELGGSRAEDVSVVVAKFDPKSKAKNGMEYCARYPLAGFDPFNLPLEWGPGHFRMRFCRGGKIFKHLERSFAAPMRAAAPPAALASPMTDDLRESRQFERNLLTALVTAIVGRPMPAASSGGGLSAADMVALFREGRESAKTTPMPFDQLKDAISLGRELAGGGSTDEDDDDSPRRGRSPTLLDRFGPQLMGLLERAMAAPAPPAAPVAINPPDPAQPPSGDPPPESIPPAATEDPLRAFLKAQASKMIAEAQAGRDARTWGAFMAERCPKQFQDHLHRFASATDQERQAFLADVAPELIAYHEWVSEACDGVLDVFEPDDETEGEEGAGDVS